MAADPAPDPEIWVAAAAWARSGLLALSGPADGPPVVGPLTLPPWLDAAVDEIEQRTTAYGRPVRVSWANALTGRAALLGLRRQGRLSANGSCRLLEASDGWLALNLPRGTDLDLIPALTGRPDSEPWAAASDAASGVPTDEFVGRARLLGLAAAGLAGTAPPSGAPYSVHDRWDAASPTGGRWRVVDLSALWAGPLAARILAEAGGTLTTVHSLSRPDGAVATPSFYRWLHGEDAEVVEVDLRRADGRARIAELLDGADVVIEGSRPRALEQLGLAADDRADRPGRVWLSITGYGRDEPGRNWVAFGDDAAVSGGMVGWDDQGRPVFCGDAIADPLTGVMGALAVLRARDAGGGQLIDLAMSRVAAAASGRDRPDSPGPTPRLGPDGRGAGVLSEGGRAETVRPGPSSPSWITAAPLAVPSPNTTAGG